MSDGRILTYVQYPDLTEIYRFSPLYYHEGFEKINTEFLFYIGSPGHPADMATERGMKPVAAMNNWWPSHCCEARKLILYWYKNPKGTEAEPLRHRWHHLEGSRWKGITKHLAGSGCGFKIGEPPMRVSLFNRYFTLMRMPVDVKPIQKKWLAKYSFKHLDTGKLASYYVNGWDPATYNVDAEFAHFGITQKWWEANGEVDAEFAHFGITQKWWEANGEKDYQNGD